MGAAWDGGGPQACPGGHRPSACQVPCTHTRAFRCLQGPQAEGARLSSAGRLLRSLRRAHSAVCDLKTPRTGCWFCGLARWQHQVLWGPVLDMGHTSAAVRSRAHGPKPAMTEGHRLVCCLSVCLSVKLAESGPSLLPPQYLGRRPAQDSQTPRQQRCHVKGSEFRERNDPRSSGPRPQRVGRPVGNGRQFLRSDGDVSGPAKRHGHCGWWTAEHVSVHTGECHPAIKGRRCRQSPQRGQTLSTRRSVRDTQGHTL